MKPTPALGQRVAVNEDAYHATPPAIGDIVVFYTPLNIEPAQPSDAASGAACAVPRPGPGPERYIKRIIAGAEDVISIARGFVVRTGVTETADHTKAGDERLDQDFPTPIVIPPNTWYLLGDNRAQSIDRRWWGPIPDDWIIGQLELPARTSTTEIED
jgi:signal peptidase I